MIGNINILRIQISYTEKKRGGAGHSLCSGRRRRRQAGVISFCPGLTVLHTHTQHNPDEGLKEDRNFYIPKKDERERVRAMAVKPQHLHLAEVTAEHFVTVWGRFDHHGESLSPGGMSRRLHTHLYVKAAGALTVYSYDTVKERKNDRVGKVMQV